MNKLIAEYLATGVEPIADSIYGNGYRCSVFLKDGTFLPCVMLRKSGPLVALAKKRFEDERRGKGIFRSGDGYNMVLETFVASGNRVSDYDISTIEPSKYAIPISLLSQIEGETSMSWTGFVLEMNDGTFLAFGTSFLAEFFNIPEPYTFGDVRRVHDHSYVSKGGQLASLKHGMAEQPGDHEVARVHRERPYFLCYYEA
jgi:hypothetical protein